jgi:hypothetical protein
MEEDDDDDDDDDDGWYVEDGLGNFQRKSTMPYSAFSSNTDFMRINIRFTVHLMVILGRDQDCYLYSFTASYTRE